MSTTEKALTLLSYFSTTRPEIGLSQFARLARRDKATVYNHLRALESSGFVEQDPTTRHYRLGPALLQLAHVREATVPRKDAAKHALERLAYATGETAHVTVLSGSTVYGLCDSDPARHATRAIIDLHTFPLHATASGLCALAFGPDDLFEIALKDPKTFTPTTPTTRSELANLVDQVRQEGFGRADRSLETEIVGTALPVFDQSGHMAGAVAVACVAFRFSAPLELTIKSELITAAREITREWGGKIPPHINAVWEKFLETHQQLESAQ